MAADQKAYLRSVLRDCRSGLTASYVAEVSRAVQRRLLEEQCYRDAATVVLYAAKDNEVETGLILADALAVGRRVRFPRVSPFTRALELVRVTSPTELAPGTFGLLEPTGTEVVPVIDLGPALICVPGLGFTPEGQRLGRGGGYYDRLLAEAQPESSSAGLAYSFQLLDQLPESPSDRRLNLILTESATYVTACVTRSAARRAVQGGIPRCC